MEIISTLPDHVVKGWHVREVPGVAITKSMTKHARPKCMHVGWRITHVPSGLYIQTDIKTYTRARVVALLLKPAADWTQSADDLQAGRTTIKRAIDHILKFLPTESAADTPDQQDVLP